MSSMYKTAKGANIDFNSLKLNNEHVVAVGNAGVNARGDLVERGKVIKTREQIMQETYNIKGHNVVNDARSKIKVSANDIQADSFIAKAPAPPVEIKKNTVEISKTAVEDTVPVFTAPPVAIDPPTEENSDHQIENKPRGGLADAINRSKEISEKMEERRKRI